MHRKSCLVAKGSYSSFMARTIVYRKLICAKCRVEFVVKESNMNPLVKCPTGDGNVVNAGGEKITLEEGATPPLPEVV